MARYKNANWELPGPKVQTWDQAGIAVLMDIRDALQELNRVVGCANALAIPRLLRQIARNTARFRCRVRPCLRTFETARGRDQHERRHA